MLNKIALLYNCPFVSSFINKYCLWELTELGYEVYILDMSSILEKEYVEKTSATLAEDARFIIIKMYNMNQVEDFFKIHATDTLFFPMFDYIYSVRGVFRLISKYNIEYAYTNTLLSPLFYTASGTKVRISKDRLNISHLRSAFFHRFWRRVCPHKQASDIFFCGKKGEDFYFSEGACGSRTKRKYLYSFDLENLIRTKPYHDDDSYAVFIDQYIPFHPDNTAHKHILIDPDVYYSQLEVFLHEIEKKLKLKVIVASHPQANYTDKCYLNGFQILYGETASLIKNATLICAHFSTAAVFAVMLRKPLILINIDVLKPITLFQNAFESLSETTGAKVITRVEEIIEKDIMNINIEKYNQCIIENIAIKEPNDEYLWKRILETIERERGYCCMTNYLNHFKRRKFISFIRSIKNNYEQKHHRERKNKYGYDIIRTIDRIAKELSLDIWIEWGTLLGLVREGKLIEHDYDIDFATYILSEQQYKELSSALDKEGFVLVRQFSYRKTIVSETYKYKNTLVDIDYCERDDKGLVYLEYDIGEDTVIEKKKNIYKYFKLDTMFYHVDFFKLHRATFDNGIECNVPDDTESHITRLYGKDWKIPVQNFNCKDLNNYELSKANPDFCGWRRR